MSKVYRVYVEKRKDFAVEADEIFENLKTQLKLSNLEGVSVVNRYDVQGVSEEVLNELNYLKSKLVKVEELKNNIESNLEMLEMLK